MSWGFNQQKTHPFAFYNGYRYPSIHAELDAFRKRPRDIDLSKCTMINIRLSRSSIRYNKPILRMSKPCIYCDSWVRSCNFKDVFYSTDNGFETL